eukprot:TRINITY_DN7915_c0_g1_i1.p1 TRINITY_DN7915_c0_g1~~TRINITY_DN7915_c0_g1_i1.p1  ORF type:complete len:419 (+),score=73.14 TRINITY_DN7915_c0_g1_i1:138-1259(+)
MRSAWVAAAWAAAAAAGDADAEATRCAHVFAAGLQLGLVQEVGCVSAAADRRNQTPPQPRAAHLTQYDGFIDRAWLSQTGCAQRCYRRHVARRLQDTADGVRPSPPEQEPRRLFAVWHPDSCACHGGSLPQLADCPDPGGVPSASSGVVLSIPMGCTGAELGGGCEGAISGLGSGRCYFDAATRCCLPVPDGPHMSVHGLLAWLLGSCAISLVAAVLFAAQTVRHRSRVRGALTRFVTGKPRARSRFRRRAKFLEALRLIAVEPAGHLGTCSICLEDLAPGGGEVVRLPVCTHTLHYACARYFLDHELIAKGVRYPRCPECRRRVTVRRYRRRRIRRRPSHERPALQIQSPDAVPLAPVRTEAQLPDADVVVV